MLKIFELHAMKKKLTEVEQYLERFEYFARRRQAGTAGADHYDRQHVSQ